jgi:hypothetical protein
MNIEQILTERKMFQETNKILKQEHYMFNSLRKVERDLQSGKSVPASSMFTFKGGTVEYQIESYSSTVQKVTFILCLDSKEISTGYGFYDTTLKKMVKWREKN